MSAPSEEPSVRRALYPGSFDFLTNGHMDIVRRSASLFDELIVAVAHNSAKEGFFTPDERVEILKQSTANLSNVIIHKLPGLTVEYAMKTKSRFIIRGLRAVSDFEFELQIANMNHRLNSKVETIFLAADPENIFLSSRVVKDVWRNGGDITRFVPEPCLKALESKHKDLAN